MNPKFIFFLSHHPLASRVGSSAVSSRCSSLLMLRRNINVPHLLNMQPPPLHTHTHVHIRTLYIDLCIVFWQRGEVLFRGLLLFRHQSQQAPLERLFCCSSCCLLICTGDKSGYDLNLRKSTISNCFCQDYC